MCKKHPIWWRMASLTKIRTQKHSDLAFNQLINIVLSCQTHGQMSAMSELFSVLSGVLCSVKNDDIIHLHYIAALTLELAGDTYFYI